MSISVERVPDEPIILATIHGHITPNDLAELFRRSAEIAQEIGGHIYRITDMRYAEATFPEMMEMLKAIGKSGSAPTRDSSVTPLFVGNSHWTKLLQNALQLKQFGGVDVQVFEDLESALKHVFFVIASTPKE